MKNLNQLQEGDYIVFAWFYNDPKEEEIWVARATCVYTDKVLVHFLYGYKSVAEFIKNEDVIAIGDKNATGKIKNWSGNYNILQPQHRLLNQSQTLFNNHLTGH